MILATTHHYLSVLEELVRAGADLNLQNEVIITTAKNISTTLF